MKDKAAGKPSIKNAILHFLAEKGGQLSKEAIDYYVALLATPSMEAVPVPPEKRGPPQIGKTPRLSPRLSPRDRDLGLR